MRNRVYARQFDARWIKENLPDQEKRRLDAAYRKGQQRAAAWIALVVGLLFAASFAWVQYRERDRAQKAADQLRKLAAQLRKQAYAAAMNTAERNWEEGNVTRVLQILDDQRPKTNEEKDLRGFEWRHLWQLCHEDKMTLRGHTGMVFAVAYTPKGDLLITGGYNGKVIVWNAVTGAKIKEFKAQNQILAMVLSPDGKTFATSESSGVIRIWQVGSWNLVQQFRIAPRDWIPLAYAPKGRLLACGNGDNTITLWDVGVNPARLLRTLKGDQSRPDGTSYRVFAVVFTSDGKTLYGSFSDNTLRRWDVASGRPVGAIRKFPDDISALAVSPDGTTLAQGEAQGILRLWDPVTQKEKKQWRDVHPEWIDNLAFSPDGKSLAIASWGFAAHIMDTKTGKVREFLGHSSRVNRVAFSPDGNTLATGSSDHTVKLWDVAAPPSPDSLPLNGLGAHNFADSSSGRFVAAGIKDAVEVPSRKIRLWDLQSPGRSLTLDLGSRRLSEHSLIFTSDSQSLLAGCMSGEIVVWNIRNGTQRALPSHSARISCLALSPDTTTLAVGYNKPEGITLRDFASNREICRIPYKETHIADCAFSPDGTVLAYALHDPNIIYLLDVKTKCIVGELPGHRNAIARLAFAPDGKSLAACDWEGEVIVWDTKRFTRIQTLAAHRGPVNAVAFSPDGKTLATGGEDGMVKLWNVDTWQEVAMFPGKGGKVYELAFSKNGDVLAALSEKQIQFWHATTPEQIAEREKGGW